MAQVDLLNLLDPEINPADRPRSGRSASIGQRMAVEFSDLLGDGQPAQAADLLEGALDRLSDDLARGIDAARARLRVALRKGAVETGVDMGEAILARGIHAGRNREVAVDRLLTLGLQFEAVGRLRILLRFLLGDGLAFLNLHGLRQSIVLATLVSPCLDRDSHGILRRGWMR